MSADYTIKPAEATVAAEPAQKQYAAADPAFTAEVTGLLGADTSDVLKYEVTRPGAGVDEAVGEYEDAIVASGDKDQGNYTVSYKSAKFYIKESTALTVSCEGYSAPYDGESHSATATASVDGAKVEYSTDGSHWSSVAPSITDAGTTKVTARASKTGYQTATCEYELKVTRAEVTVTPQDASKTYGEADPAFTAAVEGTFGGDTVKYTVSRTNADVNEAGTYEGVIVASGDADQGNYFVKFGDAATFEIKQAGGLTVSCEGYDAAYDGEEHSATATASVADGTTVEYSVDGGAWSADAPTIKGVGELRVRARATNPNYVTAYCDYTLKVTQAEVTVTPQAASKTYGEADPAFTAVVEGTFGGDEVEYTVSRTNAGVNEAGTYAGVLVASGASSQGNYSVKFGDAADFTVNPLAVTVSVAGATASATYDAAAHSVEGFEVTGATSGLYGLGSVSLAEGASARAEGTAAGTYAMGLAAGSFVNGDANFDVTFEVTDGSLEVARRAVSAGAEAAVDYDGAEHVLDVDGSAAEGLLAGDSLYLSGASVRGTEPGTYTEVSAYEWSVSDALGADVTANYELSVSGTLTVRPAGDGGKSDGGKPDGGRPDALPRTGDPSLAAPGLAAAGALLAGLGLRRRRR